MYLDPQWMGVRPTLTMPGFGLLLLRVTVGGLCILHGLPKLLPLWGGSPADTAALFTSVGLEPAYPLTVGSGIVESLGGVLLMAGAYTWWIAALVLATRLTVGWYLHLAAGFAPTQLLDAALQVDLLLIGATVCLLLAGPGALSVDARRQRAAEVDAMGRARFHARRT